MHLCIYASEAAAAMGSNPYRHAVSVLLDVWKRYHQGAEFLAAQDRVAQRSGVAPEQIDAHDALIARALVQTPELKTTLDRWKTQVAVSPHTLPLAVVQASREICETLMSLKTKPDVCKPGSVLATVSGADDKAVKTVSVADVSREVTSQLQRHHGITQEPRSVRQLKDVTENNTKFHIKALCQLPGHITLNVGGRIDGLRDKKRLVEIKNRKAKFMMPLPEYDVIQLHCYMYLLNQTEADMSEHLPDGRQKVTAVRWNPTLWATVKLELTRFALIFHKVLYSERWQDELLAAPTLHDQRAVYFRLYTEVVSEER